MTVRGKTTPDSTNGSYAPHSGARSRVEIDHTDHTAVPAKSAADVLL